MSIVQGRKLTQAMMDALSKEKTGAWSGSGPRNLGGGAGGQSGGPALTLPQVPGVRPGLGGTSTSTPRPRI